MQYHIIVLGKPGESGKQVARVCRRWSDKSAGGNSSQAARPRLQGPSGAESSVIQSAPAQSSRLAD